MLLKGVECLEKILNNTGMIQMMSNAVKRSRVLVKGVKIVLEGSRCCQMLLKGVECLKTC